MNDEVSSSYAVIVIGGGAAGLNGALMLARSRRSVLVIDAGQQRNTPAQGVHGLLGHDGVPPSELMARGRSEVRLYGGHVIEGEVVQAGREDEGFTVGLKDGRSFRARRLLVASGVVDELPDIPGVRERWGRDVLHCPYCHGWEVRDQGIAVLGTGPNSVHQALLFRQLSDDVIYFAHLKPPADDQAQQLAAMGIEVVPQRVAGLEILGDRLVGVELSDGQIIERDAAVISTNLVARAPFLTGLGVTVSEHPSGLGEFIEVDETGQTGVPGVWAAGNVTDPAAQVGASAAAGAWAAARINADLVSEDIKKPG